MRDYPLSISADDLPPNVLRRDEELFLLLDATEGHFHTFCHCQTKKIKNKKSSRSSLCLYSRVQSRNKAGSPFKDLLIDANYVRQIPLRAVKVTGKEVRAYLA